MRIWDVSPGYLDRKRLLGEHRELHGLFNIISQGKKGYARHPETLRWVDHLAALEMRHRLLASEIALRGYRHLSPLPQSGDSIIWPNTWIDPPCGQFKLLAEKQRHEDSARILLPANTQQLWAQHKYSVMAHDPALYSRIGPEVAHGVYQQDMDSLAALLLIALRKRPAPRHMSNALHHMWGYVSDTASPIPQNNAELLRLIRLLAIEQQARYLLNSTALSELDAWLC